MPKKVHIFTIALTIMLVVCCILCNSITIASSNEKAEEEEKEIKQVTVYAADGREEQIPEEELQSTLQVGWYLEPVIYVYNLNGDKHPIFKKHLENYLASGEWFLTYPEVNENDVLLLAKVIYAEATEQPSLRELDRKYVGSVVINRLKSGYWGNSLSKVIYAPGQYACANSYNRKFNSYPPEECLKIAKQLLLGVSFGVPENVIFQAQFTQGSGIWKKIGVHYYCYK